MKKLYLFCLLMTSPAWAQTQLTPKAAKGTGGTTVDNCAPIGRTAKGELVYSDQVRQHAGARPRQPHKPESSHPQPPPEPEVQRSVIFGWSYDRRLATRPCRTGRWGRLWCWNGPCFRLNPAAMDMAEPFPKAIQASLQEKRSMSQLIIRGGEFSF